MGNAAGYYGIRSVRQVSKSGASLLLILLSRELDVKLGHRRVSPVYAMQSSQLIERADVSHGR